jgi:hypothetical protein
MTDTSSPGSPLTEAPGARRAWLDRCQQRHAEHSAEVAAELQQAAATLCADAQGAEAVRLAEHVCLAHLADAASLQAFVAALPPALRAAEPTAAQVLRTAWALAQVQRGLAPEHSGTRTSTRTTAPAATQVNAGTVAGATPAGPPADGPRWSALLNVVLALAQRGQAGRGQALLAAEEDAALAQGSSPAGRAYAISCNNVAMELRLARRAAADADADADADVAVDALMLDAAARARRAWASAGNWMNVERADYQLALCHAVLCQGDAALAHARQCLASCVDHGADAAERFFAHEALAHAQHARGDAAALAAEKARMQTLLAEVPQADGLYAWCAQTLQALPT